jgi:hypothetical protein
MPKLIEVTLPPPVLIPHLFCKNCRLEVGVLTKKGWCVLCDWVRPGGN